MDRQKPPSVNLLELKPKRNLKWESREDGLITVLVPKFRNRYVVRWFVPMLAKPTIKVKLDRYGSAVWQMCDGETTIGKIGEEMAAKFGEPLEPMFERIGKFVSTLEKDKFLTLS